MREKQRGAAYLTSCGWGCLLLAICWNCCGISNCLHSVSAAEAAAPAQKHSQTQFNRSSEWPKWPSDTAGAMCKVQMRCENVRKCEGQQPNQNTKTFWPNRNVVIDLQMQMSFIFIFFAGDVCLCVAR